MLQSEMCYRVRCERDVLQRERDVLPGEMCCRERCAAETCERDVLQCEMCCRERCE